MHLMQGMPFFTLPRSNFCLAWKLLDFHLWEQVLVSAPSHVMVGPFARLAQSANLARRVIRHCDDENIEVRDSVELFELLDGTTLSLLELITSYSTNGDMECSSQALYLRWLTPLPEQVQNHLWLIYSSVLMTLTGQHSCDAFFKNKNDFDTYTAALLREFTQTAIHWWRILTPVSLNLRCFLKKLQRREWIVSHHSFCLAYTSALLHSLGWLEKLSKKVMQWGCQSAKELSDYWTWGGNLEVFKSYALSMFNQLMDLTGIDLKLLQVMENEMEKDAIE